MPQHHQKLANLEASKTQLATLPGKKTKLCTQSPLASAIHGSTASQFSPCTTEHGNGTEWSEDRGRCSKAETKCADYKSIACREIAGSLPHPEMKPEKSLIFNLHTAWVEGDDGYEKRKEVRSGRGKGRRVFVRLCSPPLLSIRRYVNREHSRTLCARKSCKSRYQLREYNAAVSPDTNGCLDCKMSSVPWSIEQRANFSLFCLCFSLAWVRDWKLKIAWTGNQRYFNVYTLFLSASAAYPSSEFAAVAV